ncbi:MAG: enoyl-CoA hydratase/isomerase family protein [Alphaproteobacteria bacterium]|nr:enoyl-CoA hydratase/isomerase family protein [Alphaproteobacteria bacterium]
MSDAHVRCEVDGAILKLTLNRPDKLNAYTAQMGRELAEAFERADRDDAIRVVLVTGSGRAFCAGADISSGAGSFDTKSENSVAFGTSTERQQRASSFVDAIFNCRKPSIAAINGPAVGVGITMTLPMDIRIAADDAKIGFVFARRGLVPEAGSAWFLPQLVGLPQALSWCLSGRLFDAREACAKGLVAEAVPPDQLMARAEAIAREIAENTSAISIALTRQMLWRFATAPSYHDLLRVDGPLAMELGASPEVREGVASFLEKRKPQFPGRVSKDMPSLYPWW